MAVLPKTHMSRWRKAYYVSPNTLTKLFIGFTVKIVIDTAENFTGSELERARFKK